ncbi:hypothetical protein BHE74_00054361 [Ensete ventricosum]|nr:hypothetical protein BHE74_00054361 [Ensete ventricosum]
MGLGSEFGEEEEADGEEASHANAAPTAVIAVIRRTLAHSKSGSQEATISRLRATGVDTKGNLDLGASPAMDEKVRGRPGRRVCDAMELKDARQVEEREEGEGEEPSARREDEVRSCRLTVRKEEVRSSGFTANQPEASSSLGALTPMDARAIKALEVMKSCHDRDLVLSVELLMVVKEHYSISNE